MWLSTSAFLRIIIPSIVFLVAGIVFLAVLKSFFQKRGIIVGGVIFNGHEEFAVAIVNDNVNSMENVVNTLRSIGISEKMAIELMLRINEEGIAIVWTGTRNEALQHLRIIRQNGLGCFMAAIRE